MGRVGEVDYPEVQTLIAKAALLAHAAGRAIGIVAGNPNMLMRFMSYGYNWGAVSSDLGMLTGACAKWMTAIKGRVPRGRRGDLLMGGNGRLVLCTG